MNAEFDWWLLLVGVVAGAALTWLVLAESTRRERDVNQEEVPAEASWIARTLEEDGHRIGPDEAERVLWAHRRYLRLPPPDALVDPNELSPARGGGVDAATAAAPSADASARPLARGADPGTVRAPGDAGPHDG